MALNHDCFTIVSLMSTMCCVCLQDQEDGVYTRDFSCPTLEDHFDKTILPKVMQVRTLWTGIALTSDENYIYTI